MDERGGGLERGAAQQQRQPCLQRSAQQSAGAGRGGGERSAVLEQRSRELVQRVVLIIIGPLGQAALPLGAPSARQQRRLKPRAGQCAKLAAGQRGAALAPRHRAQRAVVRIVVHPGAGFTAARQVLQQRQVGQ